MTVLNSQISTPVSGLEQAMAKIAELEAKLAAAKRAGQGKLTIKASEKGGVSVYGLGRFPVTMYAGQWQRVLAAKEQIEAFIQANRDTLAWKD